MKKVQPFIEIMTSEVQLRWIHDLQNCLRSPWMDSFFTAWNLVDSLYFSTLVIALVWYLWDRRIGIWLFYLLIISFALNKFLKVLFHGPRPCQIDPLVGIICSDSPGFPSGAAQSAAIYFGIVWLECRRLLYRYLVAIFSALLCFSRVYLGQHYFTDILGGLLVGALLVVAYKKLFPFLEKQWKLLAIVFPFSLLFLLGTSISRTEIYYVFFAVLGVAFGLITQEKIGVQKISSFKIRVMQLVSVIVGLSILFVIEQACPRLVLLWSFVEGYWLSFLGGWLVQKGRFAKS